MRRSLLRLSLPFREPFATSGGVVGARDLLLLRLEDPDGVVGHGEAAPFEPYDGVPIERVAAALREEPAADAPPHARAAEEMARLDLRGRRDGYPLGEPGAEAIAVNRTLAAGPPEEVGARAHEGARAGYSCFKLKVGLPDDEERVAAVREAIGPWPALRLDANGAWSVEEALERIAVLARFDLQLVEQPCRTLAELVEVRREVEVPIAADEPIRSADDVHAAADAGACDVVNVKLAGAGGFTAAREALRTAADRGLERFLSSTLDGPWGIAAALQLAASEGLSLACGLATLDLFDAALARALPAPEAGLQAVPQGPGLGVAVEEETLAEVVVGGGAPQRGLKEP
ncbi:MAG: mandelate racemase/muconate lactonizing enzyme family protein [Thermoleophilaceae bacterium]